VETARQILQWVQLVVFLGAAVAAARVWSTQRSRPAALLAATFATIGATLSISRLLPQVGDAAVRAFLGDVVLIGLATFPWLLALFAWSFERRPPRLLLAAGAAVAGLALWALVLPPISSGVTGRNEQGAFVLTFIAVWAVFGVTAAARLWRAGQNQPFVRTRMRMMAAGSLALTVALLLAGSLSQDAPAYLVVSSLGILSALLFTAGFAPPRALRSWWRRRVVRQYQRMQLDLIAATTPREAAEAVAPVLASAIGGGTVVVARDGEVLAHAGMSADAAEVVASRVAADEPPGPDEERLAVDGARLVVRRTAYTPLFGREERDLVDSFAIQLRLAIQRARLYVDNDRIRRDLERAHSELQTMIVGLAHDLRNPSVAIGGYASLARATDDEHDRDEMLVGIQTSAAYLNGLVDALGELSRVGAVARKTESVDLCRTLQVVIRRLGAAYPQVRVEADTLPTVKGDPVWMEQVFDNLLTNAARHGGQADLTIRVAHREVDGAHHIEVSDDGQGIDATERDSIFVPFLRGRGAAPGGSGVGLGLVRRIVESHDGTIELLDAGPGARFLITLPI
jgi:signal transduction histidine kinase